MIQGQRATLSAQNRMRKADARLRQALRTMQDMMVELHAGDWTEEAMHSSLVKMRSESFNAAFALGEAASADGLLFRLIDPQDSSDLAQFLCTSRGASCNRGAFTFWMGAQTPRRLQLTIADLAASCDGEQGDSSDPPVMLLIAFTDLSQVIRQAERVVEQKAHRVINHTAKRVIANVSQLGSCLTKQLGTCLVDPHLSDQSRHSLQDAIAKLNAMRAQATTGFHMCKSVLMQTALLNNEYVLQQAEFSMSELFEDLGLNSDRRVFIDDSHCRDMLLTDKALLSNILYQAVQNALIHGAKDGNIHVEADQVGQSQLIVSIWNQKGDNHEKLIALHGVAPLLAQNTATLMAAGVGGQHSTFLGLSEMQRAAAAFSPPGRLTLSPDDEGVTFELQLNVSFVTRTRVSSSVESLPQGLVFACCDDDEMPRLYSELLIEAGHGHEASRVVGETYEEAAGFADLVMELASTHDHQKVIVLLDQNMTYPGKTIHGTDICRELREERGFNGTITIISANDEPEAERSYLAAGATSSIGKGVSDGLDGFIRQLAKAHALQMSKYRALPAH